MRDFKIAIQSNQDRFTNDGRNLKNGVTVPVKATYPRAALARVFGDLIVENIVYNGQLKEREVLTITVEADV